MSEVGGVRRYGAVVKNLCGAREENFSFLRRLSLPALRQTAGAADLTTLGGCIEPAEIGCVIRKAINRFEASDAHKCLGSLGIQHVAFIAADLADNHITTDLRYRRSLKGYDDV